MRIGSRPVQTLRRTPLYERHAALGARLVPFAGWEMPVQYSSIADEHRAVRTRAGVFDVSHMGELRIAGDGARDYLQARLSNDLDRIGRWPGAVHAPDQRSRRDRRRPHRLSPRGRRLPPGGQRSEPRRRPRCARRRPMTSPTNGLTWRSRARRRSSGSESRSSRSRFARTSTSWASRCLVAGTGYTGERGCELGCAPEDAVDSLGRDPEPRHRAVRARRARHAAARGLLPAARKRHLARAHPDRGRPRLGLCARQGVHRRRDVLRRQKDEGPAEQAGRLRHGGSRHPPSGHADRRRRRGHVGDAVADARGRHRPRLRPGEASPSPAPRSRSTSAGGPVARVSSGSPSTSERSPSGRG